MMLSGRTAFIVTSWRANSMAAERMKPGFVTSGISCHDGPTNHRRSAKPKRVAMPGATTWRCQDLRGGDARFTTWRRAGSRFARDERLS